MYVAFVVGTQVVRFAAATDCVNSPNGSIPITPLQFSSNTTPIQIALSTVKQSFGVGWDVGAAVGTSVGDPVGEIDGILVGGTVGACVGTPVGWPLGDAVGPAVG